MPIYPRTSGYQVSVSHGSTRIRKQVNGSEAQAQALLEEITEALEVYGQWPVPEGAQRIATPKTCQLREAARLAMETHWATTAYAPVVRSVLPMLLDFLVGSLGKERFEDITSADLDALVAWCRSKGNSGTTINKNLSILSVVNRVAMERVPPLTTTRLPIKRVKSYQPTKWWVNEEHLSSALKWLRQDQGDPLYADFVEFLALTGVRSSEGLRVTGRHFNGLGTDRPAVLVQGTKTDLSAGSIPILGRAVPVVERAVGRSKMRKDGLLFPYTERQARDRWNEVRVHLGVEDIPTSTLKALRRTFAYYATMDGMPTRTIQRLLRHEAITTTEGYLHVVGDGDLESARKYMQGGGGGDLASAIRAYRDTGATPAEVAEFTKEMMKR